MLARDLVANLNGWPRWAPFDAQLRTVAYQTIRDLIEVYRDATLEDRKEIAGGLQESAKFIMDEYTLEKANESRRTGSRNAVFEGLIPVVIAGGSPNSRTAGSLFAVMLHSTERTGLDAREVFAEVARLSTDAERSTQIQGFPMLDPNLRSIERYGYHERRAPEGVIYEHQVETLYRPKWYDRLFRRRRKTYREAQIETAKMMDDMDARTTAQR